MSGFLGKFMSGVKDIWFRLTVAKQLPSPIDEQGSPLTPPTPQEARSVFRTTLTDYVAGGWSVEIENEFDAVLSKKAQFYWVGKLVIFLILLWLFVPLGLFYLIVVVVKGVNAKPARVRVWIDEDGRIQRL